MRQRKALAHGVGAWQERSFLRDAQKRTSAANRTITDLHSETGEQPASTEKGALMDLIDILPQLEAIARRINFQPLDDLIEQIKRFCEHMLQQLTPGEPIREGGQALNAYANRLDELTTQLDAGLQELQQTYTGPASAQYLITTTATIQRTRRLQGHINDAATYHSTLANHCIEAVFQQGMLIAQGAIMAIDLGSTIATLGADAPISVPVAAGDAVVAEGSAVAMDVAVDTADVTMSAIGDSAADVTETISDLSEEGSSALEDGADVTETGTTEGDPEPTGGGSGDSGEEPPGEGGNGGDDGNGGDGSDGGDGNGDPNRQKLEEVRSKLQAGKGRVVAHGEYNIEGETGEMDAASGQASRPGGVDAPEARTFQTRPVRPDAANPRSFDAEVKILENLASKFAGNPGATGEVTLLVSQTMCESCSEVVDQFGAMFPNIILHVIVP